MACLRRRKDDGKLLYISGSYPASPEGIAASAGMLLDAMAGMGMKEHIKLLTTDLPVIKNHMKQSDSIQVTYLDNWKISIKNIQNYLRILKDDKITVIHMEYPGDCYGKTLLASILPLVTRLWNMGKKNKISFNVRLHEFTCARLIRKAAIIPILLFADSVYVPALRDRKAAVRIAGKRVKKTIIGANIAVCPAEKERNGKTVISYFGSVYPGKGIERMLKLWKQIRDRDGENRFEFKIIGEVNPDNDNHFSEYHKKVIAWLEEYGMREVVKITGYVTDEEVSGEIRNSQVATLLYEDGLTLRRGSFLAYLTHGIPIVTTNGDEEAAELLEGHDGIFMSDSDDELLAKVYEFVEMDESEAAGIHKDNREIAKYFSWDEIAKTFLGDYGLL